MVLTCISWWPESEVFIAFLLCTRRLKNDFFVLKCEYAELEGGD